MKHLIGPFGLVQTLSSDTQNIRHINADLGTGKPFSYTIIATVRTVDELTQEENLATAKLLQLAPELRDALAAFVDDIEGRVGEIPEDFDAYRNAIALLGKLDKQCNTYLLQDGTKTTSTYMGNQYACKFCGSSEVLYQQGVDDASCQDCGKWQNDRVPA